MQRETARKSSDPDPYNLGRFVVAQDKVYATALDEIRHGTKRTHWMWFILPQLAGLGHSAMARHYAISSLEEARAYLEHPILGFRYRECAQALQDLPNADAEATFGPIDALKLRSSLTLFSAAGTNLLFEAALNRWFGEPDPATLRLLSG